MSSNPNDRRQFLRNSSSMMLAGASYLATRANANETGKEIRVAVVGTGARGSDLIRKLTTIERARVVAICDNYQPHLAQGQKYAGNDAAAYTNFSKMLRESAADAVVVATPLQAHFSMCMEAIENDRAVFCEKTMCHSIDQAKELAAAVERTGAVFQVGLQRRANAIYHQAAAMVETGMLGRITAIKCQWHRNNNWRRPVPVRRDDVRWQDLEQRLNWRLYWDHSQGLMTELASHQMDVANRLLGTTPRSVIASGGIDYWRDGREVFDNVFCIYDYELHDSNEHTPEAATSRTPIVSANVDHKATPRTVRVTYSSLQNNAYEGASELVMGTKGTLFVTQKKGLFYQENGLDDPGWSRDGRVERNASIVTSGKTLKMGNDPWAHRGKPFEIDAHGDDTRTELMAFLDCVAREDQKTICDVTIGLQNTITVLIANQAIKEQQTIQFQDVL